MTVTETRTKVPREPRRQMNGRPAWLTVDDEATKIECFVLDVSPGGVKLVTDAGIDIGHNFILALVPDRPQRQRCEVVWRQDKTYGVRFLL